MRTLVHPTDKGIWPTSLTHPHSSEITGVRQYSQQVLLQDRLQYLDYFLIHVLLQERETGLFSDPCTFAR